MCRVQLKIALFVVVGLVGIVDRGVALVDEIRELTIDMVSVGGGEALAEVVVVCVKVGVFEISVLLGAVPEVDESAVEVDIDVLTAVLDELVGYRVADVLEVRGIVLVRAAAVVLDEADEVIVVCGEDVELLVECIVDICVVGFAVSGRVTVVVEGDVVDISVVEVVVVDRMVDPWVAVDNCVVIIVVGGRVIIDEAAVLLVGWDVNIFVVGFVVSEEVSVAAKVVGSWDVVVETVDVTVVLVGIRVWIDVIVVVGIVVDKIVVSVVDDDMSIVGIVVVIVELIVVVGLVIVWANVVVVVGVVIKVVIVLGMFVEEVVAIVVRGTVVRVVVAGIVVVVLDVKSTADKFEFVCDNG